MKKIITAFLCMTMIFSLNLAVFATDVNQNEDSKGVEIVTEVPSSNIVTIVTDGNSAVYYNGKPLKNGDKIGVARLSSPEFFIYAKGGFELSKVMLDADDVTDKVANRPLVIPSIHKDATLTVNSKMSAVPPQRKFTVVGTITQNGKPLVGADLRLGEYAEFTTKDDGKFAFEDVEGGFHTLTALKNGKQVGYIPFDIRPSDDVKTIEITKSDNGTYIVNIGRDYHIVELNFNIRDDGVIEIPDGEVHEKPNDITDFPKTGDSTPIIPFAFFAIGSLVFVAVLIKKRKFENGKI